MATKKKTKKRKTKKRSNPQAMPMVWQPATRSEGLVVQVGTEQMSARKLTAMAKDIAETLPGKWVVERMGKNTRDFCFRRPKGQANPTVKQAWDFTYRLREHRDVEACEPALLMPVDGPMEMMKRSRSPRPESFEVMRRAAEADARLAPFSSLGGGTELSCSAINNWALRLCQVPQAWELPLPTGGKAQGAGIVVGHPDTGYTNHPEIVGSRLLKNRGRNYVESGNDARDRLNGFSGGHGTSASSVIFSGVNPGARTIAGVAAKSKLVPLRVTTSVVIGSFRTLAEALYYAGDNRHHVVSISLGGPLGPRYLRRAVQYAIDRGVIVLAAAGNVWPFVVYPARFDEVLAIAACNCLRQEWSDSASGSTVDITAPGESVWRALTEDDGSFSTGPSSGTSYAVAMTAGATACWLAFHGRNKLIDRYGKANLASVFKEVLTTSGFTRPSNWDTRNFGVGILNVRKLLSAPLPGSVAARGMLPVADGPQLRNRFDQLAEFFPANKQATVRKSLCRMLGAKESDLNEMLDGVGEELTYHVAVDSDMRTMLMQGPAARRRPAMRRLNRETASRMHKGASRRLNKMLKKGN